MTVNATPLFAPKAYRVTLTLTRADWNYLRAYCESANLTGAALIASVVKNWIVGNGPIEEPPPPTEYHFDPDELVQLRDLEG